MKNNRTSHAGEPASAQARGGPNPPHHIHATDEEILNLSDRSMPLPSLADRQQLIERAQLVLAEARVISEEWDRSLALHTAERPAEGTVAATSASL